MWQKIEYNTTQKIAMNYSAFFKNMSEKKEYNQKLVKVGALLLEKRKALGPYGSREAFIEKRSQELFGGEPWISCRHLASLEAGKNWASVEMLIKHAYALEADPVELFREILRIYTQGDSFQP